MMQKKLIKRLFIGMFLLSLTACASHRLETSHPNLEPATVDNSNDIFIDPSIAHFMGNVDHSKLQNLVATAQAKQFTSWTSDSTGARFAFTSKEIFVNSEGQGCRDYEIKLIRGFFEHPSFNYTACRNSQGIWQVISH
jgi:surface antigen